MASVDLTRLSKLEPISTLSPGRLSELASLCFIEKVSKGIDPFRMNVVKSAQAMYLLDGELGLQLNGGNKILKGGSEETRHPIDAIQMGLQAAIALTEIEIVRIDLDLLDIMMTWDQLATIEDSERHQELSNSSLEKNHNITSWMSGKSAFGVEKIQCGVFSRLPSANIEEMFRRLTPVKVKAGEVVIRQGAEGDYYYLIEHGKAEVTRVSETSEKLADLGSGDAFGEEALVSNNKRNATVTMKSDGLLLRLNKTDFIELLKAPLINELSIEDANNRILYGAVWLDVRLPSEYRFGHQPNAINIPLKQLRLSINNLNKETEYIVYCQTGRRSSAAVFILIQHGFKAFCLAYA